MNNANKRRNTLHQLRDRLVIWLWSMVYHRWLTDPKGNRMTVVRVKGWRTAIVESNWESRKTITPCFTLFGVEFD